MEKTIMVFGQMNEPPGARLRVALTALTMAEYYRDQGMDVLLFIDNLFPRSEDAAKALASLQRATVRLKVARKRRGGGSRRGRRSRLSRTG